MEHIEYQKPKSPLPIQIGETRMTVFRVGRSPQITGHNAPDKALLGIHTHFTYEVFFVTSGTLRLVTEQTARDYQSAVLIIPPKYKHCSLPIGGESYCLLFSFEGDSADGDEIKRLTKDGICKLPISEDISFYIKALTKKNADNTKAAEVASIHLASLIFGELLHTVKTEAASGDKEQAHTLRHISEIEAFINKNISKRITLSDLSQSIYLGTKQISRIIKKEYGCTFSCLITEKRMARAEILLKNTDMKISEIAAQVFYGTETYFYTLFKSRYGMSPLQYRKSRQYRQTE